mgnify:FL=1
MWAALLLQWLEGPVGGGPELAVLGIAVPLLPPKVASHAGGGGWVAGEAWLAVGQAECEILWLDGAHLRPIGTLEHGGASARPLERDLVKAGREGVVGREGAWDGAKQGKESFAGVAARGGGEREAGNGLGSQREGGVAPGS